MRKMTIFEAHIPKNPKINVKAEKIRWGIDVFQLFSDSFDPTA